MDKIIKTADDCDYYLMNGFYWLDKLNTCILRYERRELNLDHQTKSVKKADGSMFNLITDTVPVSKLFGNISESENALNEYRKELIEHNKRNIAVAQKENETLERQVKQYEEKNSPYLPPRKEKKKEKIGSVRI